MIIQHLPLDPTVNSTATWTPNQVSPNGEELEELLNGDTSWFDFPPPEPQNLSTYLVGAHTTDNVDIDLQEVLWKEYQPTRIAPDVLEAHVLVEDWEDKKFRDWEVWDPKGVWGVDHVWPAPRVGRNTMRTCGNLPSGNWYDIEALDELRNWGKPEVLFRFLVKGVKKRGPYKCRAGPRICKRVAWEGTMGVWVSSSQLVYFLSVSHLPLFPVNHYMSDMCIHSH
jgi:hypothetical protein